MQLFPLMFTVMGLSFGMAETITFDLARPGSMPAGWSTSSTNSVKPARWLIKDDRSAPSKPNVLAQLATQNGKQDYSLALFNKTSCRDGDVSVSLKLISGRMAQSAGVLWRFQDPSHYYFALASADQDTVGIYKSANGVVSQLAHASAPHRVNGSEWNLMKVTFRGPRFVLYFGHRKLIDTQDSAFTKSGTTGLWTKADTVAYFDNFRLDRKN